MQHNSDESVWNRFWNCKADVKKVYPSSPSVLKAIASNMDIAGMKILEVGAGSGRDSKELAQRGADVTVLDFSGNSLKIISRLKEENNLNNLNCVQGDALN